MMGNDSMPSLLSPRGRNVRSKVKLEALNAYRTSRTNSTTVLKTAMLVPVRSPTRIAAARM